jgi:hypothetical protein
MANYIGMYTKRQKGMKTSDYVFVCFYAISFLQISHTTCISLSSLFGKIGMLSHFFVIKLTKHKIVLKLH